MNITFVLPAIRKKKNEPYLRSWLMGPLTIAVLNALVPNRYDREFFDDRIENIDYDTDTDLVLITTEIYTAKRAYFIANCAAVAGQSFSAVTTQPCCRRKPGSMPTLLWLGTRITCLPES